MESSQFYRSRLLVAGLSLLVLGIGNWSIGFLKLAQYRAVVDEGIARGFRLQPSASRGVASVLAPASEEGERYNIARARVDLYHVVLSGGRLMVVLGVLLTATGWVRIRLRSNSRSDLASVARDKPITGA